MVTGSAGLGPKSDCASPEAIVRLNYKPILSSERAPHNKKLTTV
jgi:hypothetical protein